MNNDLVPRLLLSNTVGEWDNGKIMVFSSCAGCVECDVVIMLLLS